jgi:hypothetical protein
MNTFLTEGNPLGETRKVEFLGQEGAVEEENRWRVVPFRRNVVGALLGGFDLGQCA